MKSLVRSVAFALILALTGSLFVAAFAADAPAPFKFEKGDVVAILGDGLADRMQHDGWTETLLQSELKGQDVRFRNMSASGDRPDSYPRSSGATSMNDYLKHVKADVVFAFFGYNDSYDGVAKVDAYHKKLVAFVRNLQTLKPNGTSAPRIVLFSPIAHENTHNPNLPDGKAHNAQLEAYTIATESAAKEAGVAYVDLFHPSLALYQASKTPLTVDSVHLSAEGNRQIAEVIATALMGKTVTASPSLEPLRQAVLDTELHWYNRYRASDGNDIWGGRSGLSFTNGQTNAVVLKHELSMLDVMTANRDARIWAVAQGKELVVSDSNVPPPIPVITNLGGGKGSNPKKDGVSEYISGEEGLKKMSVAKGFAVNLFADEKQFPQLVNPVQMGVSPKGEIWVAVWPTYPKWEPLKPMNDAILVFHADKNGKATSVTEFAKVQNPLGFEFWNGGIIVTCMTDLLFLKDTDGDGVADVRISMLQGLDTSDTHHGANNLIYGPDGAIYWQSGVFMQHNYEHPWGPSLQTGAAGMYRFDPRTFAITFHAGNSPNSHGIAFDYWGNHYATDGTSGNAFQVRPDGKGFKMFSLLTKEVRPVPASEIVSSANFPDSMQGDFIICNAIGFLGIKQYHLDINPETGEAHGKPDGDTLADGSKGLMMSADKNFRPTDAVFGSDGALYFSDWSNAIIGHMQHNVRDPERDHIHGRIYRMIYTDRPLQKDLPIVGQPIPALLENLKSPIDGIRQRTRIELSSRDSKEVTAAVQKWVTQFDPNKKEDAHHLLEALWLFQQHNIRSKASNALLEQLLKSPEPRARVAAATVKHIWTHIADARGGGVVADEVEVKAQPSGIIKDTPELTEIRIGTVKEKMTYDVKELTIQAGKKIHLTFANPDFMPHNFVIVNPGKADEVGLKALTLGAKGFDVGFVPESPEILWSIKLLDHDKEQSLDFTAPKTPGDYPYLCTFPGHHTLMRGVFHVK